MESLLDRFCRYVRIDTQADESARTYPSSPGQLELGRLLTSELQALGLRDAVQDEHGIVLATVPATRRPHGPVIAWIAHLDTSPETSGRGVKPIVHRNYAGDDIVLPGDPSKVIRVAANPELAQMHGKTLVTTDGTTLLGADDKAGVAIIMEAAAHLAAHPEIPHGPVRICFTCDEEIGRGVDHLDLGKLGAHVGYTLDGGGAGEIDVRDVFRGPRRRHHHRRQHPSGHRQGTHGQRGAHRRRISRPAAVGDACAGDDRRPRGVSASVSHRGRRGRGDDADSAARFRHAEARGEGAACCEDIARALEGEHPGARIAVQVTPQYRNMAQGLAKEPRAVRFAEQAMQRVGLEPKRTIVRGGTDGSRLTELGLPTPNLSCGEHNLHSPLEWTCLEEMAIAVRVLVELAQIWGEA